MLWRVLSVGLVVLIQWPIMIATMSYVHAALSIGFPTACWAWCGELVFLRGPGVLQQRVLWFNRGVT